MEQRVHWEVSVEAMRGWVLLPQVPLGQCKDAGSENSQQCYPRFVGRKQTPESLRRKRVGKTQAPRSMILPGLGAGLPLPNLLWPR